MQGRSKREVENHCSRGVATIPNCVSCTLPSSQSSVALGEPLPLAFYLSYQCRAGGGGLRVLPAPGEKATHDLVLFPTKKMLFVGPGVQHQEHIHGVLSQGVGVPPIARWGRFPKGSQDSR